MDIAGQARTINTKMVRPRGPKPRRAKPAPGMGDLSTWFSDEVYSTADPDDYARDSMVLTGQAPPPTQNFTDAAGESLANLFTGIKNVVTTGSNWIIIAVVAYVVITHHDD